MAQGRELTVQVSQLDMQCIRVVPTQLWRHRCVDGQRKWRQGVSLMLAIAARGVQPGNVASNHRSLV